MEWVIFLTVTIVFVVDSFKPHSTMDDFVMVFLWGLLAMIAVVVSAYKKGINKP